MSFRPVLMNQTLEGISFVPIVSAHKRQLRIFTASVFPINFPAAFYGEVFHCESVSTCAVRGNQIVSAISCKPLQIKDVQTLYITLLGTLPLYRNTGLASRLLKNAFDIGAERRVSVVWLHVQTSNDDAISFYSRHGFSILTTKHDYYRRLDDNSAHILVKVLDPCGLTLLPQDFIV